MRKIIGALFCGIMMGTASLIAQENMLRGAEFNKENGWSNWTEAAADSAGVTTSFIDDKFIANIPATVKKSETNVQLMNSITLEEGKTYQIAFTATAEKAGAIRVVYLLAKAPWTNYTVADVAITAGTAAYKCTLAPKQVDGKYETPKSLRFFLGNLIGNKITIEKVVVTEVK